MNWLFLSCSVTHNRNSEEEILEATVVLGLTSPFPVPSPTISSDCLTLGVQSWNLRSSVTFYSLSGFALPESRSKSGEDEHGTKSKRQFHDSSGVLKIPHILDTFFIKNIFQRQLIANLEICVTFGGLSYNFFPSVLSFSRELALSG